MHGGVVEISGAVNYDDLMMMSGSRIEWSILP